MSTKPYEELKELASEGPFYYEETHEAGGDSTGFNIRGDGEKYVAWVESEADAQLIAHRLNNFDTLLEALKAMTPLARIKYGNLDPEIYAEIEKAEDALKQAQEVQV